MKPIHNYILLVDNYRRPSRQRNTAGRYRVGAKSEKEAKKLLRNKIQFGSIQVYYQCEKDDTTIGYKEIVKEEFNRNTNKPIYKQPLAATAARNKKD